MGKKRDVTTDSANGGNPRQEKKPKRDKVKLQHDEQPAEVVVAEVPGRSANATASTPLAHEQTDQPASGFGFPEPSRGSRQRGESSVPPETLQYLEEVVVHFKTLTEGEEKELLVGNVLEELRGKEAVVAGDQVCSRHVEVLLAAASSSQLAQFLESVHGADGFQGMATSPFGSHVLEKVMVALDKGLEGLGEEEYEAASKVLAAINETVCSQLFGYITDRFATHVARRLLCVATGRNVLPANKQQQRGQVAAKMKGASGLANKLGPKGDSAAAGTETQAARFPDLVLAAAQVMCREDYQGPQMADIVFSPYASPYVQGLLRAVAFDRKALTSLIPCVMGASFFVDSAKAGKVLEGVEADAFAVLVRDSMGSHVVEVVAQVAPPALFEELYNRFFKGNLWELCQHPSANFVVQAAIASATTPALAKAMFEELQGQLGELLRRRRSGVVAALVAACGRCGVCQKEACAALEKALMALPVWSGVSAEQALAPALLCLDSPTTLGPQADPSITGHAARLSTLGASILICVLGYGQGACRQFTDSVAALQGGDAAKVAADPSGSRVVEALLEGSAPAKVKARLMQGLKGSFGKVATTAAGSFVVERCYNWGEPPIKEAIASELVASKKDIEGTHWGPSLLKRVGAEHMQGTLTSGEASTKALAEFSQIFGDDGGKKGGGPADKGSKKKAKNAARAAAESAGQLPPKAEEASHEVDGDAAAATTAQTAEAEAASLGGLETDAIMTQVLGFGAGGDGSRKEAAVSKKERKAAAKVSKQAAGSADDGPAGDDAANKKSKRKAGGARDGEGKDEIDELFSQAVLGGAAASKKKGKKIKS